MTHFESPSELITYFAWVQKCHMGHMIWLTNKGELGFRPIIQNHKSLAADEMRNRNFQEHVLAYVTPWNNHGYVRDQTKPLLETLQTLFG